MNWHHVQCWIWIVLESMVIQMHPWMISLLHVLPHLPVIEESFHLYWDQVEVIGKEGIILRRLPPFLTFRFITFKFIYHVIIFRLPCTYFYFGFITLFQLIFLACVVYSPL